MICDKCKGLGYIPRFAHIKGGVCFQCRGLGVVMGKQKPSFWPKIPPRKRVAPKSAK